MINSTDNPSPRKEAFSPPPSIRESGRKKIVSVVGARPQFIKAATVSKALMKLNDGLSKNGRITEMVVHTGQHYDSKMSGDICKELGLAPVANLGINGGSHGEQTSAMIRELEKVFVAERPDVALLYGDTNSTVAGAMAAAKLGITVAHVEAGLRSFNRAMPEEINRVITDHVSNILFAPNETAMNNLFQEGIKDGVYLVGDVMYDALQQNLNRAQLESRILETLGLESKSYLLVTIHRAENTADARRLQDISTALTNASVSMTVIWPMHPRTRRALEQAQVALQNSHSRLTIIDPVSYLDMLVLQSHAHTIVTDSGGIQKEAAWLGIPCVTLRGETEWVETVQSGWNVLAGTEVGPILDAISKAEARTKELAPFPARTGAAAAVAAHLANRIM